MSSLFSVSYPCTEESWILMEINRNYLVTGLTCLQVLAFTKQPSMQRWWAVISQMPLDHFLHDFSSHWNPHTSSVNVPLTETLQSPEEGQEEQQSYSADPGRWRENTTCYQLRVYGLQSRHNCTLQPKSSMLTKFKIKGAKSRNFITK